MFHPFLKGDIKMINKREVLTNTLLQPVDECAIQYRRRGEEGIRIQEGA